MNAEEKFTPSTPDKLSSLKLEKYATAQSSKKTPQSLMTSQIATSSGVKKSSRKPFKHRLITSNNLAKLEQSISKLCNDICSPDEFYESAVMKPDMLLPNSKTFDKRETSPFCVKLVVEAGRRRILPKG